MSDKRQHWFCFSYIGKDIKTGNDSNANTYTGYDDKNISLPMINGNKENAGVTNDAVLISVSYLGYMTKSELVGE